MLSILGAFLMPHPPILVPEVGKGREEQIRQTSLACKAVAEKIKALAPDTIVLVSPHAQAYAEGFAITGGDKFKENLSLFGAAEAGVRVELDTEFSQALAVTAASVGLYTQIRLKNTDKNDHGTVVPLIHILKEYADFRVVKTGISGLRCTDHYEFGRCIADVSRKLGRRTVFVASGDLSHRLKPDGPYGFDPAGPEFDQTLLSVLSHGDFAQAVRLSETALCEQAGECAMRPLLVLAGSLNNVEVRAEVLSYEDTFGVGYAVISFMPHAGDGTKTSEESAQVSLARYALETYIKTGRMPELPAPVDRTLLCDQAGVFVCIKRDGRLRGCIGTIKPVNNCLAEEILHNAVSAGTRDPRFPRVSESELPELQYTVDVLTKPEKVETTAALDVRRYGLILETPNKRGLLLPDLDGVDTVYEQIAIVKSKAGITDKEPYTMYRFEVIRYQ